MNEKINERETEGKGIVGRRKETKMAEKRESEDERNRQKKEQELMKKMKI